jgi:outer membrane protein W
MELAFRDDTGNGSERLDVDDLGTLKQHVGTVELLRYMLAPRRAIVPYGSAGFVGTWWMLDDNTARIDDAGGKTQFRFGAIGSLGVQLHATESIDIRVEAASMSVRNPFAGGNSFRALGGTTIDEPTRVNRTDFRLAAVYNFGGTVSTRTADR